MKFSTDDGKFEAEVTGGKAKVKFNLGDFQSEFSVQELPAKLEVLRQAFIKMAERTEFIAGQVKRELKGDDLNRE